MPINIFSGVVVPFCLRLIAVLALALLALCSACLCVGGAVAHADSDLWPPPRAYKSLGQLHAYASRRLLICLCITTTLTTTLSTTCCQCPFQTQSASFILLSPQRVLCGPPITRSLLSSRKVGIPLRKEPQRLAHFGDAVYLPNPSSESQ